MQILYIFFLFLFYFSKKRFFTLLKLTHTAQRNHSSFATSLGSGMQLQCNREGVDVFHFAVLAEDKRLIITAVLLYYFSVRQFEPYAQFCF